MNVDCWDIKRNALNFAGKNAVIAHPPCRAWSRMRSFAKPLPGEKELAFFSIDMVRKNGGVLEHPESSKLFPNYLPVPGSKDSYGGFTISIDQFWWGHKARKRTFLYIVDCEIKNLPLIPMRFDALEYCVGNSKRKSGHHLKEISQKERSATPLYFALWLIELASKCSKS